MRYDKDRYYKISKDMVNIPIIYVEGKSNKIFYEQLRELENTFVQNGGSCIDIKKSAK